METNQKIVKTLNGEPLLNPSEYDCNFLRLTPFDEKWIVEHTHGKCK